MVDANEEGGSLSYTASLITQGKHRFYSLTIPSDVLARTCFVVDRDEDPIAGFQRLLDKDRAQQIADYIDAGFGTIPTSVVLSAQSISQFTYQRSKRTVRFLENPKSFLVLDGQHRIYGFHLAKSLLRVPVVIYNELTRVDESRLFIDINTKQKPVPNELLLDIRKLAEYRNDLETRLGDIFDLFTTEPSSPLFGSMSPSKRKKNQISRVTFNAAMKPILGLFGEASSSEIYRVVAAYLTAFMGQATERKLEVDVAQPIAFRAILSIFPEIAQRVRDRFGTNYASDDFAVIVSDMLKSVKPSSVKNVGNSVSSYAKIFMDGLKTKSIF
ncbi:DGQHR domain-containing protein [Mesorhizobium sp. WSM2561]|uniref:DGQHR domain-containing protein n=1 Tax=Mesorhizobium sp. WSM2561 TaxID=1040985 RepID=UPI00047F7023|nr:DGQHR domain-containing protein [Mesorhizobium sp. WSM2561]